MALFRALGRGPLARAGCGSGEGLFWAPLASLQSPGFSSAAGDAPAAASSAAADASAADKPRGEPAGAGPGSPGPAAGPASGGRAQPQVKRTKMNPGGQRPQYPAQLSNVSRYLTRQDIVDFFYGCNLSPDQVRVQYTDDDFRVLQYWVNFPTSADRARALSRSGRYLGTRYAAVRPVSASAFSDAVLNPLVMSSRGRYLLVSGLSSACTSEDVLRFFEGCALHAKAVTFVRTRSAHGEDGGQAIVRLVSHDEAQRALRSRQWGFINNCRVQLRLLQ